MVVTGTALAGLVAVAIIVIGVRFLLAPVTAARGFGVPGPLDQPNGFSPWLCVKGSRDIASGLFVVLLMTEGSPRLLGEFLIVACLIPIGDAAIVLRAGGSRSTAFGIHGGTALFMLIASAILIVASR